MTNDMMFQSSIIIGPSFLRVLGRVEEEGLEVVAAFNRGEAGLSARHCTEDRRDLKRLVVTYCRY